MKYRGASSTPKSLLCWANTALPYFSIDSFQFSKVNFLRVLDAPQVIIPTWIVINLLWNINSNSNSSNSSNSSSSNSSRVIPSSPHRRTTVHRLRRWAIRRRPISALRSGCTRIPMRGPSAARRRTSSSSWKPRLRLPPNRLWPPNPFRLPALTSTLRVTNPEHL